jgi:hypothetical protein
VSARAALAIARREFTDRWLLVPFGLFVGVWPIAIASTLGRENPPLPRPEEPLAVVISTIYWVIFGVVAAGVVGFSIGGRDLAERRLGFFFARPVSWATTAAGQSLAAATLLSLSILAAMLPLTLSLLGVEGRRGAVLEWGRHVAEAPLQFLLRGPVVTLAVLALVVAAGAGLFGIAFRVRSRWLALDLAGLLAVVALALHLAARLEAESAFFRFTPGFVALTCGSAALALAGGLASALARGRGDAQRAHRAFSLATWPVLALFAALGLWRVEAALLGDPAAPSIRSVASPDGRWEWRVSEKASWLWGRTVFLVRTDGGAAHRIGSDWLTTAVFSEDSRRIAWTGNSLQGEGHSVVVLELGPGAPRTLLTFPGSQRSFGAVLAFTPAGDRLVHVDGDRIRLRKLDGSGVEERELPAPAVRVELVRFQSQDRLCLRATHGRGSRVRDYEVSLAPGGGVEPGECRPAS